MQPWQGWNRASAYVSTSVAARVPHDSQVGWSSAVHVVTTRMVTLLPLELDTCGTSLVHGVGCPARVSTEKASVGSTVGARPWGSGVREVGCADGFPAVFVDHTTCARAHAAAQGCAWGIGVHRLICPESGTP